MRVRNCCLALVLSSGASLVSAAKQAKDAEDEEYKAVWSNHAVKHLVDLKMKHEKEFGNTTDTTAKVWEHVHQEYMQKLANMQKLAMKEGGGG